MAHDAGVIDAGRVVAFPRLGNYFLPAQHGTFCVAWQWAVQGKKGRVRLVSIRTASLGVKASWLATEEVCRPHQFFGMMNGEEIDKVESWPRRYGMDWNLRPRCLWIDHCQVQNDCNIPSVSYGVL